MAGKDGEVGGYKVKAMGKWKRGGGMEAGCGVQAWRSRLQSRRRLVCGARRLQERPRHDTPVCACACNATNHNEARLTVCVCVTVTVTVATTVCCSGG